MKEKPEVVLLGVCAKLAERDDLGHCGLGLRAVWYKNRDETVSLG